MAMFGFATASGARRLSACTASWPTPSRSGRAKSGCGWRWARKPRDVLRLVIGQALKLAALGLAIGLPVALALGRVMAGALFGVVALDPMTFVAFTLLLTGVATLAGYLPARRAMRVDPMVALFRTE